MKKFWLIVCYGCLGWNIAAAENKTELEDVIAEVNPTVVSIVTETEASQALGAGIIISADGYVVTNAHVTEGAQKITLTTVDDEIYEAELIGTDEKTDIALLKAVKPLNFEPATFADSENIRVGNKVFAIGNPFGLGNSVSAGIVSAKERDIEKGPYDNFIQTDAAINQGNSGGPLFNLKGEIIGMNTAIFSTDGLDTGVGFAVPSNTVKWVAEQLKLSGKVVRGWLGIGVQKIRSNDNERKNKLIVASMAENSPAAEAGIQVGDILEQVGDLSLKTPRHFSLGVAQTAPNTVLPIMVARDGKVISMNIKASEMQNTKNDKTNITETEKVSINSDEDVYFPEIGIKAVFDEVKQEFVITEVEKTSEAAAKGINVGDKFNVVNNRKVYGIEDLRILIKEATAKGSISLQFIGEDMVDLITLKLRKTDE